MATLATIHHELSGTQVFHFVGHALAFPEMHGLLLAERDARTQRVRLINADSIGLDAVQNLQLAVLSACDTGLTTTSDSSGTEGLVQALLHAGVPHVVASRWRVDSTVTAIFMRRFYEQLLAGAGVAVSLHAAQLAVAARPAYAHPYYWAAFGVQGS
jgi:CHAT domain-containing protein